MKENLLLNVQAIFDSIDGEVNGFDGAGELTTFIRLKGCNLICGYCDTKYAQEGWPENWMTIDEIIQKIHFPKITITGGEPLLQEGAVEELCNRLVYHLKIPTIGWSSRRNPYSRVTIETNGTIEPTYFTHDVRYVVDYKLPSSGVLEYMTTEVFKNLRHCDVIKFVIADEHDYKYALGVVVQNTDWKAKIVFSPMLDCVWDSPSGPRSLGLALPKPSPRIDATGWPRQLAEMMIRDRVPAQFSLQLHKILWPGAKEER